MPGGDRTGPRGAGPMTGRGAGFCAGSAVPGYANRGVCGRGFGGGGRGRGRGHRHMFYATGLTGWQRAAAAAPATTPPSTPPAEDDELQQLKQQAEAAAATLDAIRQRIDELQNKPQA